MSCVPDQGFCNITSCYFSSLRKEKEHKVKKIMCELLQYLLVNESLVKIWKILFIIRVQSCSTIYFKEHPLIYVLPSPGLRRNI